MNKVMIVDDEDLVREKIIELIKVNDPEVEVVCSARNGKQALDELLKNPDVDIVITDIRMPVMDGLTLIEKIREQFPLIRFIIISGYAEFEYARRAMALGINDYILKPVREDDLSGVLRKVAHELNKSRNLIKKLNHAERIENGYKEAVLKEQLGKYLLNNAPDIRNIGNMVREFPNIKFDRYALHLIHIENIGRQETFFYDDDMDLVRFSICNIVKDTVEGLGLNVFVLENALCRNRVALLCGDNSEVGLFGRRMEELAETVYFNVKSTLKLDIITGVGISSFERLKDIYGNAVKALDSRFFSRKKVFYYSGRTERIPIEKNKILSILMEKFKILEGYISGLNNGKLYRMLNEYIDELFHEKQLEGFGLANIRYVFIEFINLLSQVSMRTGSRVDELTRDDVISGEIINGFDSNLDMIMFLKGLVNGFNLNDYGNYDCENVVNKVNEYIKTNFEQDLSLNNISAKFAVNSSYFSRIFKEETGVNYSDYVNMVRIDKARELLTTTTMSILDIALSVGYAEQQYFNRVFKKVAGVAPKEYRNISKNSPKNK